MSDVQDEIRGLIESRIAGHERSLQTAIGASEIGTPCARQLGFRLAGVPRPNAAPGGQWRQTVGTAVHEWLAQMLIAADKGSHDDVKDKRTFTDDPKGTSYGCPAPWCDAYAERKHATGGIDTIRPHTPRFEVELHVAVGTIAGVEIMGHIDAYDRATATVLDWKVTGPTSIKTHKGTDDPGWAYRTQLQLYARGVQRKLDLPVERVALYMLPSNGELRDAWWWEEEYDPRFALRAMTRVREIDEWIKADGAEVVIPQLKRTMNFCSRCDWFVPATKDLAVGCPGAPEMKAGRDTSFDGML